MKVKLLGAHSYESVNTRLASILVDDKIVIDAGGLTSSLFFPEQNKISSIILTHGHYDHIRDVPAFALRNHGRLTYIYATESTLDILTTHFINGLVYPDFTKWPSPENPALRLIKLEEHRVKTIEGYQVLPVSVPHALPAVGIQITDSRGKKAFYSGDTGPGLSSCWSHISPDLMLMDMHYSNKSADIAHKPGHMCPSLLLKELMVFQQMKGYLPQIVLTHLNPEVEDEIKDESAQMAMELDADITLAHEDMEIII